MTLLDPLALHFSLRKFAKKKAQAQEQENQNKSEPNTAPSVSYFAPLSFLHEKPQNFSRNRCSRAFEHKKNIKNLTHPRAINKPKKNK